MSDPRSVLLRKCLELIVQEGHSHLNHTVSPETTPSHVLAFAHSATNDAIDRRFDEAR